MGRSILILILLFTIIPVVSYADISVSYNSHGKLISDVAPIDINDKDSIKRGAKYFANYCLSCHSAFFMRYNRVAHDTGMTEEEVRELMIFTRDKKDKPSKIGDLMKVSMTGDYAKNAFGGAVVPDLSLTARARGADWLYTYLRTFYIDIHRPMGVNNLAFSDVSMPHVLWELQGQQEAVYKTEQRETEDGEMQDIEVLDHLKLVSEGKMSVEEYDAFVTDLVNFMVYLAEPVQVERRSLGWKVLAFLFVFFIFAYLLKKEYWKDIH